MFPSCPVPGFLENGQINVVNEDKTFHYQYKSRLGNKNLLTVQSLSLNAGKNMKDMTEFLVYTNYYGDEDYADKWVSAAEAGTPTSFKSG